MTLITFVDHDGVEQLAKEAVQESGLDQNELKQFMSLKGGQRDRIKKALAVVLQEHLVAHKRVSALAGC